MRVNRKTSNFDRFSIAAYDDFIFAKKADWQLIRAFMIIYLFQFTVAAGNSFDITHLLEGQGGISSVLTIILRMIQDLHRPINRILVSLNAPSW